MTRSRLDVLLVERGLCPSREQARAAILAGEVRVGDRVATKAGEAVDADAPIVIAERQRFVSRGGDKLAGALATFGVPVADRRAIDVGASTGGFTDCLLQGGATSVVALDVGYGQLAWSLRTDERVTVLERTNIRSVDSREVGGPFDMVVCDVSFISLATVMVHLAALLTDEGDLLALVKPQFEAGKGRVGKKGVVREPEIHVEVLESACESARAHGLAVRGLTYSPVKGPEGNIEFWLWASPSGEPWAGEVRDVVVAAHAALGGGL